MGIAMMASDHQAPSSGTGEKRASAERSATPGRFGGGEDRLSWLAPKRPIQLHYRIIEIKKQANPLIIAKTQGKHSKLLEKYNIIHGSKWWLLGINEDS